MAYDKGYRAAEQPKYGVVPAKDGPKRFVSGVPLWVYVVSKYLTRTSD